MKKNPVLLNVLRVIGGLSIPLFFVTYIIQSTRQYAQIVAFIALLSALGIYALTKKK